MLKLQKDSNLAGFWYLSVHVAMKARLNKYKSQQEQEVMLLSDH